MRKNFQPEFVTCDICGYSYIANFAQDRRSHESHHSRVLNSHDQTFAQYGQQQPLTWFRPKVKNPGVYLVLNQLNPRLLGFTCTGLTEGDWQAIQKGESFLEIGQEQGDGHDRSGQWQAPDGALCNYHANWRCGHIHFWAQEEKGI